jgi:polyisoprenoid-binding protein YceI
MTHYLFVILVHFTFAPFLNNAEEDTVYYTDSGHAEFTSSVPLHTFTGKSSYLTGLFDPEENAVDFYLDLNTLRTGINRRDRDMFRTLEVEEFPFAEFTGTLDSPFDLNSSEEQTVSVTGEFTVHGVTREKTVEGTLQNQGGSIKLRAEWVLDISDYDIEPPGLLFYRVRDEIEMLIEAELQPVSRDEL